jgi:DNA polymerase-3 subunit delta'
MSWANIIGQDKAVSILKENISKEKIANAYLFYGPEGVGKLKTAVEFAKSVNCNNKTIDNCDRCSICQRIEKGICLDVRIIKPQNNQSISIETIRELKKDAYYKPLETKRKFYIIDKAEAMTKEAANSFLKLLEEPPLYNTIILITANYYSLLPTIVSRAQPVRFKLLEEEDILAILRKFFNIDDTKKAKTLACISYGSMAKAKRFINEGSTTINIIKNILNIQNNFAASDKILALYKDNIDEFLDTLLEYFHDKIVLNPNEYMLKIIDKIILAKQRILNNANKTLVIDSLIFDISSNIDKLSNL